MRPFDVDVVVDGSRHHGCYTLDRLYHRSAVAVRHEQVDAAGRGDLSQLVRMLLRELVADTRSTGCDSC